MKFGEVPDIVKITKKCGVKVYQGDLNNKVTAFYIQKRGKFEICVNIDLPITFQRFLVAYLFSYIRIYGDTEICNLVYNESIYDRKAYFEALHLLMPDIAFSNDILQQLNLDEKYALANKYKISEELIFNKMIMDKEKQKFKVLKFKEDKK